MNKVPARAPVAAANPCAGDVVAGLVEPAQFLDVKVDQLPRPLALVAAHGFGRVDLRKVPQPFALEPTRHGGPRQLELGVNRCPGHPQGPAQMHDQRHRRPRQPTRDMGGRACVIGKRRAPALATPREPFARGADRNRERRRDLGSGLARENTDNDLFSTLKRQVGILVRVVHPCGSSVGVWQLQPNPVQGEQSPDNLQVALADPGKSLAIGDWHDLCCTKKFRPQAQQSPFCGIQGS